MKTVHLLICTALVLGIAIPASAGNGTHFLVEPYSGLMINQGLSVEDAVGLEAGAMFAIGGKLKGFPPRFYLYFKVSNAQFGSEDVYLADRGAHGEVKRSYTRLVGGLRTIIPLLWNIRLNLEFGGGSMFSENLYTESGRRMVDYKETLDVLEFGVGLNVRLYTWLSMGLMYDYTMVVEDELGDMIASHIGEDDYGSKLGWSHLSVTLGLHF